MTACYKGDRPNETCALALRVYVGKVTVARCDERRGGVEQETGMANEALEDTTAAAENGDGNETDF